jgi:GLPGLI family protein
MKKITSLYIALCCSLFITNAAIAQTNFLDKVNIEFEKKVSYWGLIKDLNPEWFERAKDNAPKEVLSYYTFTGDTNRSVYKQSKEAVIPRGMWYESFAENSIVYNDYKNATSTASKPVFEQTFLVQDSMQKITWKYTNDTRNIAGFECRKVIGFLNDTTGFYAFYTDEIMISGGPESISGLPGMILGLAVPGLHTTWFATKVELGNGASKEPAAPTKGKKTTRTVYTETIRKLVKDWGKEGNRLLVAYII